MKELKQTLILKSDIILVLNDNYEGVKLLVVLYVLYLR